MKKLSFFAGIAAVLFNVSCQRPQSEAERNAQVEQEVQQRLAAERQADEQQRLAQQQADLNAREQALADRENLANETATPEDQSVTTTETTHSRTATADDDSAATDSYDTFYRKLEPYGAWRETSEYGYVWQPEQAQRSRAWRPYTDGRWAYTDAGWTWVSEEPFGWATYHYGRWTRLRGVGWVWVPGEEWAPAWVSWRKSDEYVGWAPLPPEARFDRKKGIQRWADSYYDIDADEYVFVPNEAIGSQQLERDVVPVDRNVTIVTQTTNVTNITYNNTIIVNQGPSYEELRAHSRQPLERFRLERRRGGQIDTPQPVVRGDVLAVTAPVFRAQAVDRPRTPGEPIRQVQVERNWAANVNQAEAERAREKMKSEATPPPDAPAKRYEKPMGSGSSGASPTAAAAAASATPTASAPVRPLASPSVAAAASPTATATVSASPSLRPTASAIATATPVSSATPSPSPRFSVSPTASSSPGASMTPRVRPSASGARASSPSLSVTPAATATPTPITTPSPFVTATPRSIATPAPSANGSPHLDAIAPEGSGIVPGNASPGMQTPRMKPSPPARIPAPPRGARGPQPLLPNASATSRESGSPAASPASKAPSPASTPAATMTPRARLTPPPPTFTPSPPKPTPAPSASMAPTVATPAARITPPVATAAPPVPTASPATGSGASAQPSTTVDPRRGRRGPPRDGSGGVEPTPTPGTPER